MTLEERHISQIVQTLIERYKYLGNEIFNIQEEIAFQINPITHEKLTEKEKKEILKSFSERIDYKISHDGAILIPVSTVTDPKLHEEWYEDWLEENTSDVCRYYWKRLENYLESELSRKYGAERAGKIVKGIDEATNSIISKIANPQRKEFNYKGLVVGYVQSGKTANFTALIAKAVDAGYKFIIVLAGIHNILRKQTQLRLDKELTGINDLNLENYISLPSSAKQWNRLTTARNDFTITNLSPFSVYCRLETPSIAIIKKHVGILNQIITYISQAPEKLRENLPVLIIDDEADQASIDTNANNPDPDADPSRTNECIRKLLLLFSRKVYIGYTATPFANVLIDMNAEHNALEDDLYPRNFIVSLPEPEDYLGTSKIFRGTIAESFVQVIPNEGNELIRRGKITESLSKAVDLFIIGCAVRNLRSERLQPMSMLVHVSHRVQDMTTIKDIIDDYIGITRKRLKDRKENDLLKNDFQELYDQFIEKASNINTGLQLKNYIPDFQEVWPEITEVMNVITILELNHSSDDRLDYNSGEEIKVIAVGGNQLSRGLTLEGLMASYFLRSSKQYDTLLQMGRWFGYRQGYEDLTRVHTTEQIWEFFEHLALVEEELRGEIYRYEEEGATPAQLALAIRDHSTLNLTAKNKMGAASYKQTSFSQSLNQTIWFPLDKPDILTANYNLGESFIRRINKKIGFKSIMISDKNENDGRTGVYLAKKKLDGELVLTEFLNKYTFLERENPGGPGLDAVGLLEYINRRLTDTHPELNKWSFAVVGNKKPVPGDKTINYGGLDINRIQRSRKHTQEGYNIGVLTEPDHLRIDLQKNAESPYDGRSPENPLLLLYLLWSESKAGKHRSNPQFGERIDLYRFVTSEKKDILGIAIVLPKSDYEPNSFIGQ